MPADPQASIISLLVGLLSTSLVVVDGNVAIQVKVAVGGRPLASRAAAAADVARQQLARLARAREGDVVAALTIGFPVASIDEILAGIPSSFAGFQQLAPSDGTEVFRFTQFDTALEWDDGRGCSRDKTVSN